jgi:hypothetical protein
MPITLTNPFKGRHWFHCEIWLNAHQRSLGLFDLFSELRHDAKQFGNERPTPRRIRLRHRPPRPLPKRRPVTGIEAPSAPCDRAIDRGGSSFKERLARCLPLFLAALKRERNADPVRVA